MDDSYRHLVYSTHLPIGRTCYRAGAEQHPANLLRKIQATAHTHYENASFCFADNPISSGWMFDFVLTDAPVIGLAIFADGHRVENYPWSRELQPGDNVWEVAKTLDK